MHDTLATEHIRAAGDEHRFRELVKADATLAVCQKRLKARLGALNLPDQRLLLAKHLNP